MLVNEIGRYNGVTAVGVVSSGFLQASPGPHVLNIDADGAWQVTVRQLSLEAGVATPMIAEGFGDAVTLPVRLTEGLHRFSYQHNGRSNFVVMLYAADGARVDLLVNEIGAVQGTQALPVQRGAIFGATPGVHVLVIQADGAWTAKVEKL